MKVRWHSRLMVHIFIVTAVSYAVLVGLMFVFQRQLLYKPDAFTPTPRQSLVPEMQEVRLFTQDGLDLLAWVAPPGNERQPWVVLFHGNAGAVGGRGGKARVFLDAGYGVFLVEYRGYGGNPGTPSETGLMNDARAALAYLGRLGVAGQDVVLYGESLGTGVAVAMAVEAAKAGKPVRALLLEAPYTTIPDVGAKHYPFLPVRWLMKDRYDSLSRIRDVRTPLLIVHGNQDWVVPQSLGRQLFAAALEPKTALWVDGAGHNDVFGPRVTQVIFDFLAARAPG